MHGAKAAQRQKPMENLPNLKALLAVLSMWLFTALILLALYGGWQQRNEYYLSAEYGTGYALGIIGGSMMLLLLVYPVRKRFFHSSWFFITIKNWFKLHMVLGILGPICILYHCNFGLGSVNSNVALISMGLMVTSGLIGRFLYTKIHYGLYGERMKLKDLEGLKELSAKQISGEYAKDQKSFIDDLTAQLAHFEHQILRHRSVAGNFLNILSLGLSTRTTQFKLKRLLARKYHSNQKPEGMRDRLTSLFIRHKPNVLSSHIASHLKIVRRIAGLSFYERLFSLWHMLHLPIFFMLIVTGLVHVYAVHAY